MPYTPVMPHPAILLDLSRRYCEPHRHYHTLDHISQILLLGRDLQLTDEQILGIWFHDAVYDPHSSTNEVDSADLAVKMLNAANYAETSIAIVRQIVLDTEKHRPTVPESELVIDLDLSFLALPWKDYEWNRANIRKEYHWLSEDDYHAGLRDFLHTALGRERLFWTEWGARLEACARSNLQRALDALTPK